jgi:Ca2+-binding RTX toxin-like protein
MSTRPKVQEAVLGVHRALVRLGRGRARTLARVGLVGGVTAAMVLGNSGTAGAVEPDSRDLDFILKQILRAEAHPDGNVNGPNPATDVISALLPEGLRTVSGVYNNLVPGQEQFGAADVVFPRLLDPNFRSAENLSFDPDGPGGPQVLGGPTSYEQTSGLVQDSAPRTISNLIVDMTANNPAAVAAAANTPNSERFDHDGDPNTADLFRIPNRSPDVGLSAPYNSWFTAFGQFFDHGLDLVTKGGGTVYMPLDEDDPLFQQATPENPVPTNFMVLSRATGQPGPDGTLGTADDVHEHTNTTTPFVDQNQTYTSHPSHQVFLREYETNAAGEIVSTGKLLDSDVHGGGLATWADVKEQAGTMLGIELSDADVLNVPVLKTDAYGKFEPGPSGHPQFDMGNGTFVEANPADNGGLPVPVPAGAKRTNHAFLDDIAHSAVPVGGNPGQPVASLTPDEDAEAGNILPPGSGQYDNELLEAHFITGDGRGNENIGLTAVHHVFHTEHNLLVRDIKDLVLVQEVKQPGFIDGWQLPNGEWRGERLFQAARFMTEMEYQHLVFEEFARKVQPAVDLFAGYQTDIDPSITAEFAHTVYRFGHSMLTEKVARTSADGQVKDMDLLDAFLNPLAFNDDGAGNHISPNQAAGALARGMSDQVGNEIDEFVTDAVRNNLLGLPLDLAAINLARGRDTGVPSLNTARRQFYAATSHPALLPYESWTDFQLGIRHPESLVNFIAAFGTHPSVTAATTLVEKRAAADLLVNGGADAPADRVDYLNSTGAWTSDVNGVTTTGLDDVDFWIGGLAETEMPFGGLLGSTFNFVFETQMEKLQDGDRLYYLTRTAGLNFLTQLEENSFAELVMRTTDATHLPFDVFSTPDFRFELSNLGSSGPILNDPETSYDESTLLTRMPDGTVRYNGEAHVLMGGTDDANRMRTGEGDDTQWGDGGSDRMEGGAGNDSLLGGVGDDIITDIFGDDVIKGAEGNDAINAGSGLDLILASDGKDFVVAGSDPKETFAGAGDDFVVAGSSADVVFGNAGHDWMEGGSQADALNGEHAEPFFDDDAPSHDVLFGGGGTDEVHAEGGDDVLLGGPGQDFHEGMLGFDWAAYRGETEPVIGDLNNSGLVVPARDNLFDFYDMVEGLSGWEQDDVLRGGDIRLDRDGNLIPGHTLTPEGVAQVDGLGDLLGTTDPTALGTINNVILGGGGADLIQGRGGDDVIDGDSWLNVQLEVPNLATPNPSDVKLVDGMVDVQADVFAGRINPADIKIVRSIESTRPGTGNIDVAEYSGPRSEYDIRRNDDGSVTVVHVGNGVDGTDTLHNVEFLRFAGSSGDLSIDDASILGNHRASGTVTIGNLPAEQGRTLSVSGAATFTDDGYVPGVTEVTYEWQLESSPRGSERWASVGAGTQFTLTQDHVGKRLRVVATFLDGNNVMESLTSEPTGPVANVNDAPNGTPGINGTGQVRQPLTATTDGVQDPDGIAGATFRYQWQRLVDPSADPAVEGSWTDIGEATRAEFTPADALAGNKVRVVVSYADDYGTAESVASDPIAILAIAPDAPGGVTATPDTRAATVSWNRPSGDGGSAITTYEITATTATSSKTVTVESDGQPTQSAVVDGLENGVEYTITVTAINGVGRAESGAVTVTPGALPAGPATVTATGGNRSIHIVWDAVTDDAEPVTGYRVKLLEGTTVVATYPLGTDVTSLDLEGLANGTTYTVEVSALNRIGASTPTVTTVVPATVATAPGNLTAYPGVKSARVEWTRPDDDGGSAITGYRVRVLDTLGGQVGQLRTAATTGLVVDGLINGHRYRFEVWAVNGKGDGATALSNTVKPANLPGAPRIKSPSHGRNGGEIAATARWEEPRTTGGSRITGYRVLALRVTGPRDGRVVERLHSPILDAGLRSYSMVVPDGVYRFRVAAYNAVGKGPRSERSDSVRAR